MRKVHTAARCYFDRSLAPQSGIAGVRDGIPICSLLFAYYQHGHVAPSRNIQRWTHEGRVISETALSAPSLAQSAPPRPGLPPGPCPDAADKLLLCLLRSLGFLIDDCNTGDTGAGILEDLRSLAAELVRAGGGGLSTAVSAAAVLLSPSRPSPKARD
jgi:hypothetical protein